MGLCPCLRLLWKECRPGVIQLVQAHPIMWNVLKHTCTYTCTLMCIIYMCVHTHSTHMHTHIKKHNVHCLAWGSGRPPQLSCLRTNLSLYISQVMLHNLKLYVFFHLCLKSAYFTNLKVPGRQGPYWSCLLIIASS